MTVQNLINNLRRGTLVTEFMVTGIINELERIQSLELRLATTANELARLSTAYSYARNYIKSSSELKLTSEETESVETALAEYERLKEAVWWMLETIDTKHTMVSYASDKAAARGLNGAESLGNIRENARKAVEEK